MLFIGFGVGLDFLGRQRRTRRVLARRIADHAGEITNQEHDLVPKLLELPHLINKYGVPDVQVWCGRVESGFDDERPALL